MFAAERDHEQIIVEVKSFLGVSRIRDFESAIGQYVLYRLYLSQILPERVFEKFWEVKFYANRLTMIRIIAR
jgi:hypothetical protein